MTRYHIIKRMRKLLGRLSQYLQGSIMSEAQLKETVNEIEKLTAALKEIKPAHHVPHSLIARVAIFIEAFKHHSGIEVSKDDNIMSMPDLKDFLSRELGIKITRHYLFGGHRSGMPLHYLYV